MRLGLALVGGLLLAAGCAEQTYEIDFSRARGFQWDGRVRITKATELRVGPFLTLDSRWKVQRIELVGREGHNAVIHADGYEGFPMAMVVPAPPAGAAIMGVTLLERPIESAVRQLTTRPAENPPAASPEELPADIPLPPADKQPYAQHLDELTLADWWAVALRASNLVSIQFEVPDEDLTIWMQGRPDQYGPAVVEIRNRAGKALKRFERQQLEAKKMMH